MAYMEFLSKNLCDTTSMIKVESNSTAVQYLIDRNKLIQYQSDGYDSNTSTIISVEFNSPEAISHILLQNHNFKNFRIFYDSVTANSIGIYTGNSDTNSYISIATTTASSVQIQIDSCMSTTTEKAIGQLVITDRKLIFENNPSAKRFTPNIDRIQVKHIMADGGIVLHNVKDKYKAKIKLEFISEVFYQSLLDIFEIPSPLYYIPFPTTTVWDGVASEVVWTGDFNFKYAENVKQVGYSGEIVLEETTNG